MLSLKEAILNQKSFGVSLNQKFNDAPFSATGALEPGWKEPSYSDFFTRMADKPILLEQSTVLPMSGMQMDLDQLDINNIQLDYQRDPSTGANAGLTNKETEPDRVRKQLNAVPMNARTTVSDLFLEENIEEEEFLSLYLGLLGERMGPAFELTEVYANKSVTTPEGEGTALKHSDGLIAQAQEISADNTNDAYGLAKLVYSDNVLVGVLDAIERYIEQDGDLNKATLVMPPIMYARLMRDIMAARDTPLGDAIIQDGNMTKIMGVELKQDNVLKDTLNGYDKMKFNADGEYKGNGSNVTDMKYAFLGQPNNLVFGMARDFDVKNQWDIDVLGYKVAMLCKGDAKINYDQDTLVIPFTKNTSA